MLDHPSILIYRLRFVFAGIAVFAVILMALLLLSATTKNISVQEPQPQTSQFVMEMSDSPNVISNGMASVVTGVNRASSLAKSSVASDLNAFESAVTKNSKSFMRGVSTGLSGAGRIASKTILGTGRIIGASFLAIGRVVSNSLLFAVRIPAKVVGFFANLPVVRSTLRPSEFAEVPIIDPNSPELHAALMALPPEKVASPSPKATQTNTNPVWPIHGKVTTNFGVPHWPYQKTHTGIDISSGQASGTTPVKPFRPGKVISAIRSGGLGNHVIVDHGSGVTSVYAHLASISVKNGQDANLDTILGFEGSTGTSTGTHLHLEIRVDGQAANPRQFINGLP